MGLLRTIIRGELLFLRSNKGTLYTTILFVVGWSVVSSIRVMKLDGSQLVDFINNETFILANTLGIFILYTLSTQAFVSEKKDSNIETVLCTPITLRKLWIGKTIGVLIPTHITSIAVTVILALCTGALKGTLVLPNLPLVIYILFVTPILFASVIGILGFSQLVIGMKENRILSLVIMAPVFTVLISITTTDVMETSGFVNWNLAGMILAISVMLLTVTSYLAKYLSKERIITTLD